MKKLLLGITVLALVLFASSAMATDHQGAEDAVLDYDSYGIHQLVIEIHWDVSDFWW